jgi:hypothetical protein
VTRRTITALACLLPAILLAWIWLARREVPVPAGMEPVGTGRPAMIPAVSATEHERLEAIRPASAPQDAGSPSPQRFHVSVRRSDGRPIAHALVTLDYGPTARTSSTTDQDGRCEVVAVDPRSVRAEASGFATCVKYVRPGEGDGTLEFMLPDAATLLLIVRGSDNLPVAYQDVDLQPTESSEVGIEPFHRGWTDERGELRFSDLGEVEYVVRCQGWWRWDDADWKTVRPVQGASVQADITMPTRSPDSFFEVEVVDARHRIQWDLGVASNYVLQVRDQSRVVSIPEHGRPVVSGKPGELRAVRLARVIMHEGIHDLAPLGEWVTAAIGQGRALSLTLP